MSLVILDTRKSEGNRRLYSVGRLLISWDIKDPRPVGILGYSWEYFGNVIQYRLGDDPS